MKAIRQERPKRTPNVEPKIVKEAVVEEVKESTSLDDLVTVFFENNEQKKLYDKEVKAYGALIKTEMAKAGIKEFTVNGIKAVYSIVETFDFDEELLIPILKEILPKDVLATVIKTKEYVDFDSLDNARYEHKFDPLAIQKAQTVKETIKLVVSKAKAAKNPFKNR